MPQELHRATKQSHDSHMPLVHGFSIDVRHRKTQRRKQVSFAQPQDSKDYKKQKLEAGETTKIKLAFQSTVKHTMTTCISRAGRLVTEQN